MKNDKWLIYTIVIFTSSTTFLLLFDGSLFGFVRSVGSTLILDGLVAYWDEKRMTLQSDKQRKKSGYMMWAGVGMVLLFAIGYGIETFAPADTIKSVDVFGFSFAISLPEFIEMLALSMIGSWAVLTLGMVLYLRGIDPETKKELSKIVALEEANAERNRIETEAYKTAMNITAKSVGTEKALRDFRQNLVSTGFYKEFEVDLLVEQAKAEILLGRTGVAEPSRVYNADVEQPSQVFTKPSTHQK